MKKKLQLCSILLALTSVVGTSYAEVNTAEGKQKASACTSCHGEGGNSSVTTFPKLAQQHASYLEKQLHAFKDGSRNDPMMSVIALTLSDQDMANIAAYYATQKISTNRLPASAENDNADKDALAALLTQGSDMYRNGDIKRAVSACIACHGPLGEGNRPASFPALESQHADYLIKTLTDFKSGARSNNPENIMHMIAKKMTDEEIKAVAHHISMMK